MCSYSSHSRTHRLEPGLSRSDRAATFLTQANKAGLPKHCAAYCSLTPPPTDHKVLTSLPYPLVWSSESSRYVSRNRLKACSVYGPHASPTCSKSRQGTSLQAAKESEAERAAAALCSWSGARIPHFRCLRCLQLAWLTWLGTHLSSFSSVPVDRCGTHYSIASSRLCTVCPGQRMLTPPSPIYHSLHILCNYDDAMVHGSSLEQPSLVCHCYWIGWLQAVPGTGTWTKTVQRISEICRSVKQQDKE